MVTSSRSRSPPFRFTFLRSEVAGADACKRACEAGRFVWNEFHPACGHSCWVISHHRIQAPPLTPGVGRSVARYATTARRRMCECPVSEKNLKIWNAGFWQGSEVTSPTAMSHSLPAFVCRCPPKCSSNSWTIKRKVPLLSASVILRSTELVNDFETPARIN